MAEHDDLDRQLVAIASTGAHQLEEPGAGEVEERKGHGPISSSSAISGRSWSGTRMASSAPTRSATTRTSAWARSVVIPAGAPWGLVAPAKNFVAAVKSPFPGFEHVDDLPGLVDGAVDVSPGP